MYADPTLMDLAAAYAKRRNGRKTKHAVACDRPGAKAKSTHAAHPSWSEGVLGDKANPALVAYAWIDRNIGSLAGRTHMLLADLAATAHRNNPSASVQQAVLAAAKDMVRKGVAPADIKTFVENGGRFSRPGAKAKFSLQKNSEFMLGEYSVKVLSDLMNYMGDPKAKTAMVSYLASGQQATRGAIVVTHDGKQVSLYNPGGALIRSGAAKFSRPGAKAKNAVHAGVLAQAQANVRRAEKDYAEAKERLEAMIRYDHPEARIAQAERGVELAEKRLEEAEKALRSLHSRPGAKAKMAQVSGSAFITDNGKRFNIVRWLDLSNAPNAVQEVVKRNAIVTDEKGKEWELKIYHDGSFVLRSPTAGGKRIEGKVSLSRPGAKSTHAAPMSASVLLDYAMRAESRGDKAAAKNWTKQLAEAISAGEKLGGGQMRDADKLRSKYGFSKSTHAALPPQTLEAERKPGGGSHSEAVSRKIATLINEGKPQDQAVAIALDLERRGEL